MPGGSVDNSYFRKALNITIKETLQLAFFGFRIHIKVSNFQAKIKHVEGTFLREITLNFIVIGQRHYGRVIVVPPRGKKVPKRVNMLAFYEQML